MKSIKPIILAIALMAVSSASAFTSPSWISRQRQISRESTVRSSMVGKRVKPAKSKEEDIELTRALIMKHMGPNNAPTTVVDSAADKGVGNLISEEVSSGNSIDGPDAFGKIKDIGRKIKSKIKGNTGK
mmetsp:Transcript_12492/g.24360  ORF Transcript_12492/g.24360 Transcript_12492/m.24360 type:complete len:129 (+) Transcript_12492:101-487(+)